MSNFTYFLCNFFELQFCLWQGASTSSCNSTSTERRLSGSRMWITVKATTGNILLVHWKGGPSTYLTNTYSIIYTNLSQSGFWKCFMGSKYFGQSKVVYMSISWYSHSCGVWWPSNRHTLFTKTHFTRKCSWSGKRRVRLKSISRRNQSDNWRHSGSKMGVQI